MQNNRPLMAMLVAAAAVASALREPRSWDSKPPSTFRFLDDIDEDERTRMRTEARQRTTKADRVRQRARTRQARVQAREQASAAARAAATLAKHEAKAAKAARRAASEASHQRIKKLKDEIQQNRTHEANAQRLARIAAEQEAQRERRQAARKAESERERLQKEAAREVRRKKAARDKLEGRRIAKWCEGSMTCDVSCAANASTWRVKCGWAATCCACAECSLNSTRNRAIFGRARGGRGGRGGGGGGLEGRGGGGRGGGGGDRPRAKGKARGARGGSMKAIGVREDGVELSATLKSTQAMKPRGRGRGAAKIAKGVVAKGRGGRVAGVPRAKRRGKGGLGSPAARNTTPSDT